MYVFLDVETRGLHGEPFAVGYVITDKEGERQGEGLLWCPYQRVVGDWTKTATERAMNDAWLDDNVVLADAPTDMNSAQVVAHFLRNLERWNDAAGVATGRPLRWVADVAWPCEARFLEDCYQVTDPPDHWFRRFAPYPLLDLSTALLLRGYDPAGTFERLPDELPAHNPLHDARQTARIWHQLRRGEPIQ